MIVAVAVLARFLQLDQIPPGLWYDEALYALDGYGVSQGNFAIFFDEHGHPREPLFPWLLGLAFWLFEPTVLVARGVSAVAGTLAVVLFFPVARRFFPASWALAATAAFAVFRWHVHFSRTIFRAGLASPLILLVIFLFLRWRERRHSIDAALCGAAMGACLYTYISLRVVPFLVALWIGWLAVKKSLSLRLEWKQIGLMYATAFVVFVPLGIDYIRHPEHLFGRTDEISMFENRELRTMPDGTTRELNVAKPAGEALAGIATNALRVAAAWFIVGDHVAKHNLPYRPVFDPATGFFFALGIAACGWGLLRRGGVVPMVLLSWFIAFAMASVLSFGAPNILRMQGASPVVILVMILGLRQIVVAWPPGTAGAARRALPIGVLLLFAATQMNDYFRNFPGDVRVRQEFTADVYYEPATAVREIAERVDRAYIPEELMNSLQVQFITLGADNITPYSPMAPVPAPADGGSAAYLTTVRSAQLAAQAGQDQLSQLKALPGLRLVQNFGIQTADDRLGSGGVSYQPWAALWLADAQ